MLKGSLDYASHDSIRGWAFDTEAPHTPVRLVITVDGEFLERTVANRFRPDLDTPELAGGRHSFGVNLVRPLDVSRSHVISVSRESDGAELADSPRILAAPSEFDELTQARLAGFLQCATDDADTAARIGFLTRQIEALAHGRTERFVDRRRREALAAYRRRWAQAPADAAARPAYRALVIDGWAPVRARDAGSNVLMSHMAALQRLGFEVAFASPIGASDAAAAGLEAQGVSCCREPWFATPEEALKRLGADLDLVYLHRAPSASAYLALARRYARNARVLFSVADLHHLRLSREAQAEGRADLARAASALREDELLAAGRADVVLTHSSYEAELLRRAAPGADVRLVRWAAPAAAQAPDLQARSGLAFIGGFAHRPNLAAARVLIEQVLPGVQARDPAIAALLVGSDMPQGLRLAARPGLEVRGRVPELRAVLEAVRLTVAPLTFGAGVKGKVVDSLAAGVPCVCSPIAAEGLDLPEALSPLVAELPGPFAETVLRLHADPQLAQACAEAGLAYVREAFSEARLDAALGEALELPVRMFSVSAEQQD